MWDLLSDFGGIIGIIIPVIYFINSPISYVYIMAKLIGKIYFHRPCDQNQPSVMQKLK